jgi:transposase
MANGERKKRRTFTAEFKAEVVALCGQPGKTPYGVARELDLPRSAVAQWCRQAAIDASGRLDGALTSAEREELRALRKENRVLRQERDILKRATAFFAKEGTS